MGHVFISYSHKDSRYAHALADHLHSMGIDVWIDERLDYGSQWPHEIQKQLDTCDAFILVMSPRSFASDWVQSELQRAKRKLKPIFPLLLEGDEPWLSVESTQYFDVRGQKFPDEKFYTALKKVLTISPKATTYSSFPKKTDPRAPSRETMRAQPAKSWVWVILGGGTVAVILTACVAVFLWILGPSIFGNIPVTGPTPEPPASATSKPALVSTSTPSEDLTATAAPMLTVEPTGTDAPAVLPPLYIRVKVLTGDDGTINTPQINFYSENGADQTFEMNDLNAFRPNQYDEFLYIVTRDFCDFVGYTLTKPADSNGDDPWNVKEVFIYIDNVLVFGDGAVDSFSPITADSFPPNGNWAGTDVYKQRCGG